MLWLAVALGGSLGAVARYGVAVTLASPGTKFPVATFSANLLGSFLMGVFYILIVEKAMIPNPWRHIIMIGFLGAFTTFSTFSIEVLHLIQNGHWVTGATYIASSFFASLLAVYIGVVLTENVFT